MNSSLLSRFKWLLLLVVAFGLGLLGYVYFHSSQKLQVTFVPKNTTLKATVYKIPIQNDDVSPNTFISKDYLVKELSQDETLKLKKGRYILATSGSPDYAQQTVVVGLDAKLETITVNPIFTSEKLGALLAQDKSALTQLISGSLPAAAGYDIGDGKLYERGDWYGTTLRPKQTDEQRRLEYADTYRLLAHKENGVWRIITLPPELIISRVKYPSVPKDVLVDLNKQ